MRNINFNLIACLSREYSCLLIMLIFEINIVLLRIFMSYMKCLADVFQLKIREGKNKKKKPPHFLIQFFDTFF